MNINIKATNFSASEKLENFIKNKVIKLSQFYDAIIGADVFLKAENSQSSDNKVKVVKIKLDIPRQPLFAEKHADSFEAATDLVAEALRRQLKKHKEKIRNK